MVIHHAALYVKDLERAKLFLKHIFRAKQGAGITMQRQDSPHTFYHFGDGARLEIMHNPEISEHDGKNSRPGMIT